MKNKKYQKEIKQRLLRCSLFFYVEHQKMIV
jgi:hypothetical protein